jgi:hypothetical protein
MRDGLDFSRLSNRLIMFQATLGINQVRREDCVYECALAQTGLTYTPAGTSEVYMGDLETAS